MSRIHWRSQEGTGSDSPQESQIDRAFATTGRVLELLVHPKCKFSAPYPAGGAYSAPHTL